LSSLSIIYDDYLEATTSLTPGFLTFNEEAEQYLFAYVLRPGNASAAVGAIGILSRLLPRLAKGLEFRAVAVMACDDEVIPLQSRIDTVGEDSDLKEVYDTERQLLYVACTRARDFLLVTGVEPASEFLDDLRA
jgi:superfamily I DNA/RNA helicase